MKTRRNKRSKLHYTSKKYGGGITPKYKTDNVVEYIDGTEVTIIEQLSYKNGEWQYKIQFPDKSYRIIPESSIKRFIRKGDFMTVRVREHERELAAFAKEHPNWKRKSKPKAWNIESSDATSFEEHQKEARAAAARAYAKEQLRKKESRKQTNRIKKKTVLTKDLRHERQTVPSVEAKTRGIEALDATSFEEHKEEARRADEKAAEEKRIAEKEQRIAEEQKRIADEEARRADARAYAKEQLRKKESLDTTSFEEHQEEARRADARAYAKDMVNRHQRLMDETRVYAKKNRDTKGFKWAFDGKDWVKIDESKIEEFSKNFLETEWTEKDNRDIDLLFQRKIEEYFFREKELRDTALKKRGFDPARYASMSRDELDAILALLDATAEERDAEVYPTLEPDLEEIYMLFGKVSLDSMKFALARTNRVFERLDYLKSLGYGNPRTSEERIIWLNNYDNMVVQGLDRAGKRLDYLKSLGYENPRTSEERIIWLNNYDNMVVQATETDVKARLKYWRLWKRELEPYERDYWVSLFKRMWKAQMNGVVENRLGL